MRSHLRPPERTLVDILYATAEAHPGKPALDDGEVALSYAEMMAQAERIAAGLHARGVRRGSRVGVRITSGTRELYLAIVATLVAGAAYVPVDADDPDERAELVFGQADVHTILGSVEEVRELLTTADAPPARPGLDDDCWIIFTSGSTGMPKGVAVSHRSAAAFVDAEARMFLQEQPISAQDRVLAGLSVAFDASCEEMWLAWRYGAALVPAPRALVRTGADLGPWLTAREITIVSTVPTLAALWPAETLEDIRLLIFGGEACPPELAARLVTPGREVWNTYGPTEATVVACGAQLTGESPIRIGLPLDGWDLEVVGPDDRPVTEGATGELIIGGVGLARYLDPVKDAEKYIPMPTLGWDRAYRSGDLVVRDAEGLLFVGRADEQVKLGGRRIELGEVDSSLQALDGVRGAAAAVKQTPTGNQLLVGYLVPEDPNGFDIATARERLQQELPAALVPLLAVVDDLPTRISGKVDRNALPWPLPDGGSDGEEVEQLDETAAWVAEMVGKVLGVTPHGRGFDFFVNGGGSLTAAQLISQLRSRFPEVTVADLYGQPTVGAMADFLDSRTRMLQPSARRDKVEPTSLLTQLLQIGLSVAINTVAGLRWVVVLLVITNIAGSIGPLDLPHVSWWFTGAAALVLLTPFGRMALAAAGIRLLLHDADPGVYNRGGRMHIKLWAAERLADAVGAVNLAGAPWIPYYARALGCRIGKDVDLHTLPPVTGLLRLGRECSIEQEVDLTGYWIDGDALHIGEIIVGAGVSVGARTHLAPGCSIGRNSDIAPGSAVFGDVPAGEFWSGSPAKRKSRVKHPWPEERPSSSKLWLAAYAVSSVVLSLFPVVAAVLALLIAYWIIGDASSWGELIGRTLLATPPAALAGFALLTLLTLIAVRMLGLLIREGTFGVRSRVGWAAWATERALDAARTYLYPIYASLFTPTWLRLLGARVGKNVEASTVLLIPRLTVIRDGAFLADDTMVASYELGGGWMRVAPVKIGKRAFIGNSGMAGGGHNVAKNSLVAVLSAAPNKSKAGTSWLGSPPVKLRRNAQAVDKSLTHKPSRALKIKRGLVELCRAVPVVVTVAIAFGVLLALAWLWATFALWVAFLLSGAVLAVAGATGAAVTTIAKWVIVGRIGRTERPLWSSFVWRNEVVDTFVELVAAPWFATPATGTPLLNIWLRSIGATIGRGVWCESYWLPEADLVTLEAGSTVNRGCVVQTHLFHDRVMSMDTVHLARGATLGPNSVILPAASIEQAATVGPSSLVMRGESVPARSLWQGNPIGPWSTNAPALKD